MSDNLEKTQPNVPLLLGGKERTLRLSLRAVAQLKRLTGYNLMVSSERQDGKKLDLTDPEILPKVVWALLISSDSILDGDIIEGVPGPVIADALRQIESWIDMNNLASVYIAVNRALESGSAPAKEGGGEKKEEAVGQ